MPGTSGSPQPLLDTISRDEKETIGKINQRREVFINPVWKKYTQGAFSILPEDHPETTIELIKSADLRVERHGDVSTREFSIDVSHVGVNGSPGVNFMGFDAKQRCLAFRGEARHLDSFVDFSNWLIEGQRALFVFKAHAGVLIPKGGFKKDLSFDNFASQVEIVEYSIWLKPTNPDEEADSGPLDDLVMLSPGEDTFLEDTQPVSHGATHREEGEDLPMDVDENTEPVASNDAVSSTDSPLSDIPEDDEQVSLDARKQSNAVKIADQDHEMINGSAFEARPGTDHDAEEANKLASQLEADAALAASLSQSLANSTRYTLRRRSSTKGPEEVAKTKQESNKNTDASKENAGAPRVTTTKTRQPTKRLGKKSGAGPQTRKKKARRQ